MIGKPFLRVAGSRGADGPEAKNVAIIARETQAAQHEDRGTHWQDNRKLTPPRSRPR